MPITLQDIALYASPILLGAVMSAGAYWLRTMEGRLKQVEVEDRDMAERLARVEATLESVDKKLDKIDEKLDR